MKDRITKTNRKKANHIFRYFIIITSSLCTAISLAFTISIISISNNTSDIRSEIETVQNEINQMDSNSTDNGMSQNKN